MVRYGKKNNSQFLLLFAIEMAILSVSFCREMAFVSLEGKAIGS